MRSVCARVPNADGVLIGPRRARRGAALVEFAVVGVLAWSMVLGILEFSWMATSRGAMLTGCARAARSASLGKPLATIRDEVRAGSRLDIADADIDVEYNSENDGSGSWRDVRDDPKSGNPPLANAVEGGRPVRVSVTGWQYPMISGAFFAWLPQVRNGRLPMSASATTRRE